MDAKEVFVSSALIVLFAISFISFGINFTVEQDSPVSINNDSRINTLYSNLNETIYNYEDGKTIQEAANESQGFLDSGEETLGDKIVEFIGEGIKGIAKGLMSGINVISNATIDPLLRLVLPNSPDAREVIGLILTSIILTTMLFVAWSLYKTGK